MPPLAPLEDPAGEVVAAWQGKEKKRGRKPGSTTAADSTPRKRGPRQNRKAAVTA